MGGQGHDAADLGGLRRRVLEGDAHKVDLFGAGAGVAGGVGAPLVHPIHHGDTSAYHYIAYVTPLALDFLGFLLVLVYCAGLVSPELGSGAIRHALVRPLRRHEYLLAKLMMGMSYALLLTLLVAGTSWAVAFALGDLLGIAYGGELVYTDDQMLAAYGLGALLGLAPRFAAVAYALMISVCTRSAVAAVGAATGIWIVVDMLKYPLHVDAFVFSTYLETPWQVFINRCDAIDSSWWPAAPYCLASSTACVVLCTAVAAVVLRRRTCAKGGRPGMKVVLVGAYLLLGALTFVEQDVPGLRVGPVRPFTGQGAVNFRSCDLDGDGHAMCCCPGPCFSSGTDCFPRKRGCRCPPSRRVRISTRGRVPSTFD